MRNAVNNIYKDLKLKKIQRKLFCSVQQPHLLINLVILKIEVTILKI